jgi:REP element-mobilizing transposase RayT
MNEDAHSKKLRQNRRMDGAGVFFVSKCLAPRKPLLHLPQAGEIIGSALTHYAKIEKMNVAAWVVMPDHWHALVGVPFGETLPQLMSSLQRWFGRQFGDWLASHGTAWQDGYHETRIRSARQFGFACDYIEENPVRAGLVAVRDEWSFSSANPAHRQFLLRPWPWPFEKDC